MTTDREQIIAAYLQVSDGREWAINGVDDPIPAFYAIAFEAGAASRDAEVAKWKSIAANKTDQVDAAKEVIVEVKQERNELLADAMRYRWIKEQSDGRPFYFHAIGHKHAENLDAAIDAAIAKGEKNG